MKRNDMLFMNRDGFEDGFLDGAPSDEPGRTEYLGVPHVKLDSGAGFMPSSASGRNALRAEDIAIIFEWIGTIRDPFGSVKRDTFTGEITERPVFGGLASPSQDDCAVLGIPTEDMFKATGEEADAVKASMFQDGSDAMTWDPYDDFSSASNARLDIRHLFGALLGGLALHTDKALDDLDDESNAMRVMMDSSPSLPTDARTWDPGDPAETYSDDDNSACWSAKAGKTVPDSAAKSIWDGIEKDIKDKDGHVVGRKKVWPPKSEWISALRGFLLSRGGKTMYRVIPNVAFSLKDADECRTVTYDGTRLVSYESSDPKWNDDLGRWEYTWKATFEPYTYDIECGDTRDAMESNTYSIGTAGTGWYVDGGEAHETATAWDKFTLGASVSSGGTTMESRNALSDIPSRVHIVSAVLYAEGSSNGFDEGSGATPSRGIGRNAVNLEIETEEHVDGDGRTQDVSLSFDLSELDGRDAWNACGLSSKMNGYAGWSPGGYVVIGYTVDAEEDFSDDE